MEFRLWGGKKQNCDALGLNNFMALQQLALKSWLMSGDVFVLVKRYPATPLNPYSMRLHVIEADRVSTPTDFSGGYTYGGFMDAVVPDGRPGAGHRVFDGVEVDKNGRVVAYYISNTYPHQITTEKQEWTRVPAYGERTGLPNILHIMDSERPDQYRGVPYLAQVIEPLLQLRRYTESELMAALVQSFFTAWIETETDPSGTPFNEVGTGDIAGVPTASPDGAGASNISDDPNEYEMGPGTVTHLAPGEKVNFGSPNIPTAGFETFVKTICRLVGSALELPYDVLIKEFNSSYSASLQNAPVLVRERLLPADLRAVHGRSCCARTHQCSGLPHRSALARGVVRRSLDWPRSGFPRPEEGGRGRSDADQPRHQDERSGHARNVWRRLGRKCRSACA